MKEKMTVVQILAENINALMARHEPPDTIATLAKRSGVSRGTVGRIRNGEVATGIDTVEMLAAAYKVPPLQLLTRQDDPSTAHFEMEKEARPVTDATSLEDGMLLELYHSADDRGRAEIVSVVIEQAKESRNRTRHKAEVIHLPPPER